MEDRLIRFAVQVIKIAESLPRSVTGIELSGQLIRSSSSAALNYGEAQCAESPKDFIHKLKVVLKELRETNVNLKIIKGLSIYNDEANLNSAIREVGELIAIFLKSISTARKNAESLKAVHTRK